MVYKIYVVQIKTIKHYDQTDIEVILHVVVSDLEVGKVICVRNKALLNVIDY